MSEPYSFEAFIIKPRNEKEKDKIKMFCLSNRLDADWYSNIVTEDGTELKTNMPVSSMNIVLFDFREDKEK